MAWTFFFFVNIKNFQAHTLWIIVFPNNVLEVRKVEKTVKMKVRDERFVTMWIRIITSVVRRYLRILAEFFVRKLSGVVIIARRCVNQCTRATQFLRPFPSNMFSKFQRSLVRKPSVQQVRNLAVSFDGYGQHCFKGAVAAPYLEKVGLPVNTLESNTWTTNGQADKVRKREREISPKHPEINNCWRTGPMSDIISLQWSHLKSS